MTRTKTSRRAVFGIPGILGLLILSLTVTAGGARIDASRTVPAEIAKDYARHTKSDLAWAAHSFGEAVDRAGEAIAPAGLNEPWWLGISATRYLASFCLLVGVGVFTWWMAREIRRRAGRIESGPVKSWPKVFFAAARKPLALVVWIYGVYFALAILFDSMDPAVPISEFGDRLSKGATGGLVAGLFWLAFRLIKAAQLKIQEWAGQSEGVLDNVMVKVVATALRLAILVASLFFFLGVVELPDPYGWMASKAAAMFAIGCVAHLIIRATTITERELLRVNRLDVEDNLRARQIYTQVSVIRKIIVVCVGGLALACMLMLFQPVRQLGTSILASAGIAGVVLGLAAQKTLSNLFAGIQIAISQPIRIDDVVIVEGEWGRIEEISLTFVTVCIWDLRRLVLPINYFIEKPFQNWTRSSAKLLNSVFIYGDYTLPVEPLRKELRRLLEANPLWDGDACVLQVTDATPQAMEIRCLMTSSDAPKGWDLKCEVREGLVSFIQSNFPECLPRLRAEVRRDGATPAPPADKPSHATDGESSPGLAVDDATAADPPHGDVV